MVITKPPPQEVVENSSLTTTNPEWTPEQLEVIWQYQMFARHLDHTPKSREVEQARDGVRVKPSIRQVKKHFGNLGNLQRAARSPVTKRGRQLQDRLITLQEAEELWGISYNTLHRRIRIGLLQVQERRHSPQGGRRGTVRLIRTVDVRAYLLERIQKGLAVRIPTCTFCRSERKLHKSRTTGELICKTCTDRQRRQTRDS